MAADEGKLVRACIMRRRRTVSKGYDITPAADVTTCAIAHLAKMLALRELSPRMTCEAVS